MQQRRSHVSPPLTLPTVTCHIGAQCALCVVSSKEAPMRWQRCSSCLSTVWAGSISPFSVHLVSCPRCVLSWR
eukprot:3967802-Amphidinium_carterae.1